MSAAVVVSDVRLTTARDEKPSSPSVNQATTSLETQQALNLTPRQQYEENGTRKKTKKRERSPTAPAIISSNDTMNPPAATSNTVTQSTTNPSQATSVVIGKKEKQRPETWNKTEQQIFFNALRQNGKNFESITQCFNARQKKYKLSQEGSSSGGGGGCMQRSKEQIRHFYYRTWHKIVKYINIPLPANPGGKKTLSVLASANNKDAAFTVNLTNSTLRDVQVKCLIAFNTLMNKSQRWNKKTAVKLVELINHGWTTVRDKGKINRIRMPICKLSTDNVKPQPDEKKSDLKQPRGSIDVDVEQLGNNGTSNQNNHVNGGININTTECSSFNIQLEPQSLAAFCRVQRLAQNPFLSIDVAPEQTIKFLIQFLENKWKSRRSQFLERFNIETKNDSDDPTSSCHITSNNFTDKLVLYLNESHLAACVSSQKVEPVKSDEAQIASSANIETTTAKSVIKDNSFLMSADEVSIMSKTNNIEQMNYEDPMAMDECAIIPDDFSSSNLKRTKTDNNNSDKSEKQSSNPTQQQSTPQFISNVLEITFDQLKAGFSSSTAQVSYLESSKKERKELTFADLHELLNKSTNGVIRLKYEWSVKTNNETSTVASQAVNSAVGASSSSSQQQVQALSSSHQQQRFYLETLASVAASFLNDLKPIPKNLVTNTENSQKQQQSNSNNGLFKLPQVPPSTSSPLQQKSSILNSHQAVTTAFTAKSSSGKSVAFLQPLASPNRATVVPIEEMLQRVNEDQQNRAKQLLSDLNNAKKRNRQRKPIMVVNTGPSQLPRHLLLPKLPNKNENSGGENSPNIVYSSGPVATVVRQIVVNDDSTTTQKQAATSLAGSNAINNMINPEPTTSQNVVNNTAGLQHPFHHTYSNLMLSSNYNNLIVENGASSSSSDTQQQQAKGLSDNNNHIDIHNDPLSSMGSHQASGNITDMSLLELSLNNVDSLFATAPTTSNQASTAVTTTTSDQVNPTSNANMISTDDTIVSSTPMNSINSGAILSPSDDHNVFGTNEELISSSGNIDMNDRKNTSACQQKTIGLSSASKLLRNFSSFLNENSISLSGILSTFYGGNQKSSNQEDNPEPTTSSQPTRRPEMQTVEWTDSMNDVSLTSYFLADMQSSDKQTAFPGQNGNSNMGRSSILMGNANSALPGSSGLHMSENSRDSILFNMETIMDILPPASANVVVDSRFDEINNK